MIGCDHRALAQGLLLAARRIICAESSPAGVRCASTRASNATHPASARARAGIQCRPTCRGHSPTAVASADLAARSSPHEAARRHRALPALRSKGRSPAVIEGPQPSGRRAAALLQYGHRRASPTVIAGLALRYRRAEPCGDRRASPTSQGEGGATTLIGAHARRGAARRPVRPSAAGWAVRSPRSHAAEPPVPFFRGFSAHGAPGAPNHPEYAGPLPNLMYKVDKS